MKRFESQTIMMYIVSRDWSVPEGSMLSLWSLLSPASFAKKLPLHYLNPDIQVYFDPRLRITAAEDIKTANDNIDFHFSYWGLVGFRSVGFRSSTQPTELNFEKFSETIGIGAPLLCFARRKYRSFSSCKTDFTFITRFNKSKCQRTKLLKLFSRH